MKPLLLLAVLAVLSTVGSLAHATGSGLLRLGSAVRLAAARNLTEASHRPGLASAPDQGRWRLLRGLRHRQQRPTGRGLLPPCDPFQHSDDGTLTGGSALCRPTSEFANAAAAETVAVWDPWVRALHWTLAVSILVAWLTDEGAGWVHFTAGYTALAVVALRIGLGLWSRSEHTRFVSFVRPILATWAYARDVLRRREQRFIGHNPLGGWMIVALLVTVASSGGSGWLYTTDRFWGSHGRAICTRSRRMSFFG